MNIPKAQIAPHSSLRVLVAGMCGVGLLFVAMAGLYEITARTGSRETHGLLSAAVPGAARLTAARSRLRELDSALDRARASSENGEGLDSSGTIAARRAFGRAIADHREIPHYDGEWRFHDQVVAELARLDGLIGPLIHALERGDARTVRVLREEWRVASDTADAALRDGVVFETEHAIDHATRLEAMWRATTLMGLLLGAGSLLVTALAAWLAARAIARQVHYGEERSQELEAFSSRVAHDLLSPLQAAALALASSARHTDDLGRRVAERGLSALDRVQQIVDGLLAFARAGAQLDRAAHTEVSELLQKLIPGELAPQASSSGIELTVDPFDPCAVACGTGILTVILTNLVRNAIKFMDGAVRRQIWISIVQRSRSVRFEIHDSGPGMPAGFERHAFEPYVRGPNASQPGGGLGLGLATVKRLVEAHGGATGIASSPLGGLLAWFELPRARPMTDREPMGRQAPLRV